MLDALLRKWLRKLPHPYSAKDRQAGYRLGRPSQVQLIFDRRVTRRTPGRFRSRVITAGVVPSLHVDYKSSRIKQDHKEGRALRTETTLNNPRDSGIDKQPSSCINSGSK